MKKQFIMHYSYYGSITAVAPLLMAGVIIFNTNRNDLYSILVGFFTASIPMSISILLLLFFLRTKLTITFTTIEVRGIFRKRNYLFENITNIEVLEDRRGSRFLTAYKGRKKLFSFNHGICNFDLFIKYTKLHKNITLNDR